MLGAPLEIARQCAHLRVSTRAWCGTFFPQWTDADFAPYGRACAGGDRTLARSPRCLPRASLVPAHAAIGDTGSPGTASCTGRDWRYLPSTGSVWREGGQENFTQTRASRIT
jgi:hypothetical protein